MKRKLLIGVLLFSVNFLSAQIKFFNGDYEQALEKAKQENKKVFIDFYADWCGPCKELDKNVFSLPEVGEYINQHFIAVKIDTEEAGNKKTVRQFKIQAMPTLAFVESTGKQISIVTGYMNPEEFLKNARIATGDEMNFEDTYKEYNNTKDLNLLQKLLLDAPAFVNTQEGSNRDKWIVRMERLYKTYVESKLGPDFINKDDYKIMTRYYKPNDLKVDILKFVNDNIDSYIKNVGRSAALFVIDNQNSYITQLAREGNQNYKKELEKIKGELANSYNQISDRNLSAYEETKYLSDAEYMIYHDKDIDGYIELKNKYFESIGDDITFKEYGSASQTLYVAAGAKLQEKHHKQAIEWTVAALQFPDIDIMNKVNLLVMLGDSRKELNQVEAAKECYNQAFMETYQMDQPMTQQAIQMKIKRKLNNL